MRRLLMTLLTLALVAASCGSGGSDTSTSAASDGEYSSPLGDALGFGGFGTDDGDAEFAEQQRKVNEQVKACMAEEGFEWLPGDDQFMSFDGTGEDGLEFGTKEWVDKYGFGISTQSFSQASVGPDLVGMDDSFFGSGGDEYTDPNEEYVQSLSESDREKYYATLWGTDYGLDIDESMSDEEMDAAYEEYDRTHEPTGCMNIAQEEIFGGFNLSPELQDAIEDLYERIQSDPRIVAADAEIASCMSGKGQEYTNMDGVYKFFETQLEPLYNSVYGATDDMFADMTEEEFNALSESEQEALYNVEPEMSDEDRATLAGIQESEIAMAVALLDCGGGSTFGVGGDGGVYEEVRLELEQEFVDNNADLIKAEKSGN